jgi:hypothetical protein
LPKAVSYGDSFGVWNVRPTPRWVTVATE